MNDRKGLTISLTIIAVILGGLSVAVMFLADSKGPTINVDQKNLVYVCGDDKTPLLEGVSAYDINDGDVSDSLMVKDITVLNSGDIAKVTYVARDKHNNISEAYRIVTYVESVDNYSNLDDEVLYDSEIEEEQIQDADESTSDIEVEEATADESEPAVENQDNQSEIVVVDEPQPEQSKPETKKVEPEKQEDKTPKITLKQKSVDIGVGQTFNPSDYIKTKENVSSISIDGAINVMAPGTYPLTFKVTGPDGKTASETLVVVVK